VRQPKPAAAFKMERKAGERDDKDANVATDREEGRQNPDTPIALRQNFMHLHCFRRRSKPTQTAVRPLISSCLTI